MQPCNAAFRNCNPYSTPQHVEPRRIAVNVICLGCTRAGPIDPPPVTAVLTDRSTG
ncbi:hypothetical protein [Streptomyces olivaceoviridis]|uniref:hypothetical protein n=1 Tax=Streptomyces olivaceoviridis TaxID=1921 RepID=UPI0033238248